MTDNDFNFFEISFATVRRKIRKKIRFRQIFTDLDKSCFGRNIKNTEKERLGDE